MGLFVYANWFVAGGGGYWLSSLGKSVIFQCGSERILHSQASSLEVCLQERAPLTPPWSGCICYSNGSWCTKGPVAVALNSIVPGSYNYLVAPFAPFAQPPLESWCDIAFQWDHMSLFVYANGFVAGGGGYWLSSLAKFVIFHLGKVGIFQCLAGYLAQSGGMLAMDGSNDTSLVRLYLLHQWFMVYQESCGSSPPFPLVEVRTLGLVFAPLHSRFWRCGVILHSRSPKWVSLY